MARRTIRREDWIGKRFGRLTILDVLKGTAPEFHKIAVVKCECGVEKTCCLRDAERGAVQSCGCQGRENRRKSVMTHGMAMPGRIAPEYRSWCAMFTRCTNPRHKDWMSYGGKGIKVCNRWRSFELFLADMGKRPSHKHSLDRIDYDGDYEPSNCRWATPEEQANNKSNNRMITVQGTTMSLAMWSRKTGLTRHAIESRIRYGWDEEKAIMTPRLRRGPHSDNQSTKEE